MKDLEVRPFRARQAEAVAEIHDTVFAPWLESLPAVYGYRVEPMDVLRWAGEEQSRTWVALLGGAPVAFAHVRRSETREGAQELGFVATDEHAGQSRLAVLPELRRRGIGRALVAAAVAAHRATGPLWLGAGAYSDNEDATAFFGALGFRRGALPAPCPFCVVPGHTDDSVLATFDLTGSLPPRPRADTLVREIRDSDVEDMRRIFGEARPEALGAHPSRERILGWLGSGWGETILVAEHGGRVVGCMEHRTSGVLGIAGVLPEYRRRGIGSTLLIGLLEVMKEKGLTTALADTGHFDAEAIRLYRHLGFDTSRWLWSWVKRCATPASPGGW